VQRQKLKHAGPLLRLGEDGKVWKNTGCSSPATVVFYWPRWKYSWMPQVKSSHS